MTNIRRYFKPNDLCFFTHVTYDRKPLLVEHFDLLQASIERCRDELGLILVSWVVLPDHMHLLVDTDSMDISGTIKRLKQSFGAKLRSRQRQKSGRVWQYRFWDHIVRDQQDLNHHTDYIHYNPVKHGLVDNPVDWPHSSFHHFQERGLYQSDWGVKVEPDTSGEFGE